MVHQVPVNRKIKSTSPKQQGKRLSQHIDLFHLLSTGTMKCFIPGNTLNMCRSEITAEECLGLCPHGVYISIGQEEKNKLQKDPFMKLNYLFCIALKQCMKLLVRGTLLPVAFPLVHPISFPTPHPGQNLSLNIEIRKVFPAGSSVSHGTYLQKDTRIASFIRTCGQSGVILSML